MAKLVVIPTDPSDTHAFDRFLESRIEEILDAINPIIWHHGNCTLRFRELRDDPKCDLRAFYEYSKAVKALRHWLTTKGE